MALDLKPKELCSTIITKIDRKTQAVTAGVNFEDIDLTIEGKGSEYWDYEYIFVLHSDSGSSALITSTVNNLTDYSRDFMRGRTITVSGGVTASRVSFGTSFTQDSNYPSMRNEKITGYVGNKRHIDSFSSSSTATDTDVYKRSHFTADTSTEITSIQFVSSQTATITYSLVIIATPIVQYMPSAVFYKRQEWTAQSDTRNISGFSGEDYQVFVDCHLDSAETDYIDVRANGVATSTRTLQQAQNAGGTLSSANTTQSIDARLHTGDCLIDKLIGRKSIITTSNNITASPQQTEQYTTETDTSTEFTSVDLVPSGTVTGYVDVYLVPRGYNADLTPWDFRQVHTVSNASFAGGKSFEIPTGAVLARVQAIGESASGSNIEIDFDVTTTIDKQYLKTSTSSTTNTNGAGKSRTRAD